MSLDRKLRFMMAGWIGISAALDDAAVGRVCLALMLRIVNNDGDCAEGHLSKLEMAAYKTMAQKLDDFVIDCKAAS